MPDLVWGSSPKLRKGEIYTVSGGYSTAFPEKYKGVISVGESAPKPNVSKSPKVRNPDKDGGSKPSESGGSNGNSEDKGGLFNQIYNSFKHLLGADMWNRDKLYEAELEKLRKRIEFETSKAKLEGELERAKFMQDLFSQSWFEKLGFGISNEEKVTQELLFKSAYYQGVNDVMSKLRKDKSGYSASEVQEQLNEQVPKTDKSFMQKYGGYLIAGLGAIAILSLRR